MGFSATWPMYFCTRDSAPGRYPHRAGDPFALQDKQFIRGMGAAFGCPESWSLAFGDLPYVAVLDVRSEETVRHIMERGLTLHQARRLLTGDGASPSPAGQVETPAAGPASPPRRRGRPPKAPPAAEAMGA